MKDEDVASTIANDLGSPPSPRVEQGGRRIVRRGAAWRRDRPAVAPGDATTRGDDGHEKAGVHECVYCLRQGLATQLLSWRQLLWCGTPCMKGYMIDWVDRRDIKPILADFEARFGNLNTIPRAYPRTGRPGHLIYDDSNNYMGTDDQWLAVQHATRTAGAPVIEGRSTETGVPPTKRAYFAAARAAKGALADPRIKSKSKPTSWVPFPPPGGQ